MTTKLPLCCSPVAFKLLAQQVPHLESSESLLNGAVAISSHQLENVRPADIEAVLQGYADTIRARVRGDQPQALLAHLHELLFEEEKFAGNTDDYYNPANNYLPAVLQSKRGLPITLSLIYASIAQRLGFRAWGIGFPGHFLAGLELDGNPMIIDPFAGGLLLTQEEAHGRLRDMFGQEVEWSEELIQPISHRLWLTRILQNLLTNFGSSGHYADVAAVLEMEMLLWPEQDRLQRDLALVLARLGLAQPASMWLNKYLKNNPDDPQKPDLEQLLEVLET